MLKYKLLAFFILCLNLYPVFTKNFAYHNDFSIWASNFPCCNGFNESTHLHKIGRPLGAVLLNLQLATIQKLSDLKFHRFLSVLLLLGIFSITFSIFRKAKVETSQAFLSSLALVSLPPFILNCLWLTNSVPGMLTSFLALLLGFWGADFFLENSASKRKIFLFCFASLLCFFIYPPSSLIIAGPLFVSSLKNNKTLKTILFVSGVMIAYFLIYKILVLRGDTQQDVMTNYRFSLTTNFAEKVLFFWEICKISIGFPVTNNFSNLNSFFTILMLLLFFGLCLLHIKKENVSLGLGALILLLMTASPNLVANASLSNFRSNIAFSYFFYFSLTLLITRLLTKRQAPVFTFLLGLFCFLQLFYSHTNILKAIENNERDRERLIQQVNLFPDINKSNRVVVLQPPFDQTRVEPLYLDYRLNMSNRVFCR
jgi:hypothetical protein